MTTEEDFQTALDAHPEDWQCRLVFADWLEERGDARAEGYRALGVMRRCPHPSGTNGRDECPFYSVFVGCGPQQPHRLPSDWFDALDMPGKSSHDAPRWGAGFVATRQMCDDVAARAFAKLPTARRAELLAGRGGEV